MIEFAPMTDQELSYDEILLYVQFYEYGGHKDWRLPTATEYNLHWELIQCWFEGCRNWYKPRPVRLVRDIIK